MPHIIIYCLIVVNVFRKRNSRKVQQMSALRLQLEQQKMERWDKLQRRLEAVQIRRQARFLEMQRRSDAQELTHARLLCSSQDKEEAERVVKNVQSAVTDIDLSDSKSGQNSASHDSLVFIMNELKAQMLPLKITDGKGEKEGESIEAIVAPTSSLCLGKVAISSGVATFNVSSSKDKDIERDKDKAVPFSPLSSTRRNKLSNSSSKSSVVTKSRGNRAETTPTKPVLSLPSSPPTLTTSSSSAVRASKGGKPGSSSSKTIEATVVPVSRLSKSLQPSGGAAVVCSDALSSSHLAGIAAIAPLSVKALKRNTSTSTAVTLPLAPGNSSSTAHLIEVQGKEDRDAKGDLLDQHTLAASTHSLPLPPETKQSLSECTTSTSSVGSKGIFYPLLPLSSTSSQDVSYSGSSDERRNKLAVQVTVADSESLSIVNKSGAIVANEVEDLVMAKKRKKKIRKEKRGVLDEEMMILDALISAKQQLAMVDHERPDSDTSAADALAHKASSPTTTLSYRPRLGKHLTALYRLMRRKRSAKTARSAALGRGLNLIYEEAIGPDLKSCADKELSRLYSLYLLTAKGLPKETGISVTLSICSVHGLMTVLCTQASSTDLQAITDGVDGNDNGILINKSYSKEDLMSAISAVLSRLESSTGDNKRETGLFIRQGGVLLLRVLSGTEVGILSQGKGIYSNSNSVGGCKGGSSSGSSIDEAASSGQLMLMCRAVSACSAVSMARESIFSSGLAVLVGDLTGVVAGHLAEWVASHQWSSNQGDVTKVGETQRSVWPEECQMLPLLLSTMTRLLRHSTGVPVSTCRPDAPPIRGDVQSKKGLVSVVAILGQMEEDNAAWVWNLFTSGTISSICRCIRSLQHLSLCLSQEALPQLLLCSLLEFAGSVAYHIRAVTGTSSQSVLAHMVLVPGAPSFFPPSIELENKENTSSVLQAPLCSTESPTNRGKEMVSILRDLQLAPSLMQMLLRYHLSPPIIYL
jgi:hypothetical protein